MTTLPQQILFKSPSKMFLHIKLSAKYSFFGTDLVRLVYGLYIEDAVQMLQAKMQKCGSHLQRHHNHLTSAPRKVTMMLSVSKRHARIWNNWQKWWRIARALNITVTGKWVLPRKSQKEIITTEACVLVGFLSCWQESTPIPWDSYCLVRA